MLGSKSESLDWLCLRKEVVVLERRKRVQTLDPGPLFKKVKLERRSEPAHSLPLGEARLTRIKECWEVIKGANYIIP